MSMRGRVPRSRVSNERWIVSYSDLVTLLFGLFVVMFAVAKQDQHKQSDVSQSVDEAFRALGIFSAVGAHPSQGATGSNDKAAMPVNIVLGESIMAPAAVKQDLERMRKDLSQTLSNQVATHTVSIKMGQDGLVISLREAGFFNSGSATIKPESMPTLRQIAAKLGTEPYDLRIEGHTDNVPIHTVEFSSNWELSAARATGIARIFLDMKAVAPERISAAGYAEFHPVAPQGGRRTAAWIWWCCRAIS